MRTARTTLTAVGLTGLAVTTVLGAGLATPAAAADDRVAPTVRVSYPANDGTYGFWRSSVPVTITATDAGSGVDSLGSLISLRGAQTGTVELDAGRASFTVSADGRTTVSYEISDLEGNTRTGSFVLDIDQTAPTGAIYGGNGRIRTGDQVRLTKLCGDVNGYTRCDWSGAASSEGVLDTRTPGVREVRLDVTDGAGNDATFTRRFSVIERGVRPTIDLDPPADLGSNGWIVGHRRVTLRATAAHEQLPVHHVRHSIDGGAVIDTPGSSATATVPEGIHYIEAAAVDDENTSGDTRTFEVKVDTVAPTGVVTVPEGLRVGDRVRPEVACSDATSQIASCTFTQGVTQEGFVDTSRAGNVDVVATVRDHAGHESLAVLTVPVAEADAASSTTTTRYTRGALAGRGGRVTVTVRSDGADRDALAGGRVVLVDGTKRIGAARLDVRARVAAAGDGTATIRVPRLRPGTHRLVVRYLGTDDVAGSASKVVTVRVPRR